MKKPLAFILLVAGLCISSAASAQSPSNPNCALDTHCARSSDFASNSAASNSLASSSAHARQSSTPWRYAAEVGGGYAGALVGGFAGGAIGFTGGLIYAAASGPSDGIFTLASIAGFTAIGTVLGAGAALPYGVHWGGNATGAHGSLGATYLGGAAGLAVGIGGYYLTQLDSSSGSVGALDIVGLVVLFTAPVVGSMIGYELSLDDSSQTTISTLSAPRPTVSISPNGERGYVGLGWSF